MTSKDDKKQKKNKVKDINNKIKNADKYIIDDDLSDDIVVDELESDCKEGRTGNSLSGIVPAPKSWILDDND